MPPRPESLFTWTHQPPSPTPNPSFHTPRHMQDHLRRGSTSHSSAGVCSCVYSKQTMLLNAENAVSSLYSIYRELGHELRFFHFFGVSIIIFTEMPFCYFYLTSLVNSHTDTHTKHILKHSVQFDVRPCL